MKRDYTNETVSDINTYLSNAYNSTNNDYRDPYFNQSVPDDHRNLKYTALCVGSDANSHIQSIRDKLDDAMSVLSQFHSDVDSTSLQVYSMANCIIAILNEVNSSMNRINTVLSGLEDYSGKTITPNDIESAGIDDQRCAKLKQSYYDAFARNGNVADQYIEELRLLESKENLTPEDIAKLKAIYNLLLQNGTNLSEEELRKLVDIFEMLGSDDLTDEMLDGFMNNDAAVALYIADMKVLSEELEGNLPQDDIDKLKRFYHWYADLRFDSNNNDNINKFSDQALQNGIDTFELLCPEGKAATDDFFKIALNSTDPTVQKNIARIKFAIYTASPEYRDVLLYYLPQITLACFTGNFSTNDLYELTTNHVYIDLTIDYANDPDYKNKPFGSFFHEIGHGVDDLSEGDPFLNSSEDFYISIKGDFENSLDTQLNTFDLSDEEKKQLKAYILSKRSYNVIKSPDGPPKYVNELPRNWNSKQVIAYQKIREYYGYANFYVGKDPNTGKNVVYTDGHPNQNSYFGDEVTGTLNGDMFGAVTNNKMGLVPEGHFAPYISLFLPDPIPQNNSTIVQREFDTFPYWYFNKLYGMEFFAEAFKYGAQNIDTTDSKKVFGSTYEAYEKKMQEIYSRVPHYDI